MYCGASNEPAPSLNETASERSELRSEAKRSEAKRSGANEPAPNNPRWFMGEKENISLKTFWAVALTGEEDLMGRPER